jgi:UDP-2,3-diacylglucosamine pyrophosphatase LpxH
LTATPAGFVTVMEMTHESANVRHLIATDSRNVQPADPRHHRALFISDVHLGSKGCQAQRLLEFLRDHDADCIYLVGDIVDGWQLKSGWYWPQAHNDVLQKLLRRARKGARLVYIPGNHDEFLRGYFGVHFGGIEVVSEAVHVTADGRRYLVTHGDRFDMVVKHARVLAPLGDHAYALSVATNKTANWVRHQFGLSTWSLSKWAKLKVKNAVNYVGEFEQALAGQARRQHCDGVICGHIHHPALRDIGGVRYVNCGDWVENCTVAAETQAGELAILSWTHPSATVARDHQRAA